MNTPETSAGLWPQSRSSKGFSLMSHVDGVKYTTECVAKLGAFGLVYRWKNQCPSSILVSWGIHPVWLLSRCQPCLIHKVSLLENEYLSNYSYPGLVVNMLPRERHQQRWFSDSLRTAVPDWLFISPRLTPTPSCAVRSPSLRGDTAKKKSGQHT